ncbi:MAG: hypothetical protein HeimC2_04260 [Candidatus Heimdallarchaeota archaeon LC_2]|nr:MAG: hypothetical protein HeimC2_04260 [Candidatus Heimdallarchaeota archaeon LC_2]
MNDPLNLEESLKQKLESGEITEEEYNKLISKFGDLDLLSSNIDSSPKKSTKTRTKWRFAGSANVDGDEIDVPVKVSGKLHVTGDLKCPEMKISGKTIIDGNLTVIEELKISGLLSVSEDAKLGGTVKVSGKLDVNKNLYITEYAKISGKLTVTENIISGDELIVSGKIIASSVQSKGLVKSSGTVNIAQDLIANEFISSGGGSIIGGNLEAINVEIAKRYRVSKYEENLDEDEVGSIDNFNDLGRFVSNLVGKIVPKIINMGFGDDHRTPKIFSIEGNLIGSTVDISYTHIKGDLIADDVIIGPKVVIEGTIRYKNSITLPKTVEYQTEKAE